MELVEGDTVRDWSRASQRGWREVRPVLASADPGLVTA